MKTYGRGPDQVLRGGDNFFGVAHAIDSSRVDPIHTELKRAVDRGDRCFVVLVPPAKFPARASDRPSAESNPRDVQVRIA